MDFIIGILLTIVIILIIINFTSISISDSSNSNQQCVNNNTLFSGLGLGLDLGLSGNQIPQPVLASAPSALNNKVNLEQQTYDYHNNFFIN